MALDLAAGYAASERVVREANSSFGLGMRLFPAASRPHIYAIYAFFRHTDDLVDGEGDLVSKLEALENWRGQLYDALEGRFDDAPPFLSAVADTAKRHELPCDLFDDCIDACATDAGPVRMEDWEDLHNYCHGVAGTVGEACLRILGYGQSSEALRLSEINGRAVQLTNILRDVDEDLGLDRVYLPQTLLANFGVESEDFSLPERPPRLRDALLHASTLAVADFQAAEPMFEHLRPADRAPIVALTLRYRHLLGRLQADRFGTHGRMALGTGAKLKVLMAAKLSRWKTTWRE